MTSNPVDNLGRSYLPQTDIQQMIAQGIIRDCAPPLSPQDREHVCCSRRTGNSKHTPAVTSVREREQKVGSSGRESSIGVCDVGGCRGQVCIPPGRRRHCVRLIGAPGSGKSTVMESLILQGIARGHGLAVLDPSGRLVRRITRLVPEKHIEQVVYIDFGDPQWVPCWNPLRPCTSQDIGRSADEFVRAFKDFVSAFGDRTEHLLRQAIFGLLHLPSASLLDMATILRPQTDASNRLRARVLETVDNRLARLFWKQEFDRYSWSDVAPIQLRLGKLLTSGTAGLMLSQHESAFDLRDIMDSGRILLVDLSSIGSELRLFLTSVMFSQLYLDASSCNEKSGHTLRPFDIYCDDAHSMHTDVIDTLITGMPLPHVTLTVAHQCRGRRDAHNDARLLVGGSTLVFRVDASDAEKLSQDLEGKVVEDDLTTLDVGECIARIASAIVRVRTFPPPPIPANDKRDRIKERSRQLYYKPASQVVRSLRDRVG